jgi:putative ABC transport system ATP-binding protein
VNDRAALGRDRFEMKPGDGVVLTGVSKIYGQGAARVEALKSIDLAIEPGTCVVFLGPSGSGKTTLLNIIGALEAPSRGSVVVSGTELATLDERGSTSYRRSQVGFVFQFYNLVPTLTALENIALVLELTGRKDAERRALAALRLVGLQDHANRFPAQLSGGEQQRVAIARAVSKDPRVVLCDEPTGALDLENGRVVLAMLQQLSQHGRTVLLVTHNSAIAEMADRVVRLRSGEVVSDQANPTPAEAARVAW